MASSSSKWPEKGDRGGRTREQWPCAGGDKRRGKKSGMEVIAGCGTATSSQAAAAPPPGTHVAGVVAGGEESEREKCRRRNLEALYGSAEHNDVYMTIVSKLRTVYALDLQADPRVAARLAGELANRCERVEMRRGEQARELAALARAVRIHGDALDEHLRLGGGVMETSVG